MKKIAKEIILENYLRPNRRVKKINSKFISLSSISEKIHDYKNCEFEMILGIKLKDKNIINAQFQGEASSLIVASFNIWCNFIVDKNLFEIRKILKKYYDLLDGKKVNTNDMYELKTFVYLDLKGRRLKSVLLPAKLIEKLLEEIV